MLELPWVDFKSLIDSIHPLSLKLFYVESSDRFHAWVDFGDMRVYTRDIVKGKDSGDSFVASYKGKANLSDPIRGKDGFLVRMSAFTDSDFHRFRGKGYAFTAPANQISEHVFKITDFRAVNGMIPIICDANKGDHFDIYVVDVDNVLGYGTNKVLDEFLESWYVDHSRCTQEKIELPYKANVSAGLYFKVIYHNVGIKSVDGFFNIMLHMKEGV